MMNKLIDFLSNSHFNFVHFMRVAIFIVMAWIGGLKVFQYEADGIVPFVTNSPFMSFFYTHSKDVSVNQDGKTVAQYILHKNPEGKMVSENRDITIHLFYAFCICFINLTLFRS